MKLFWCPNTRASRVVWMLEEAGVAYERVLVDIRDPEAARDLEFAAASPMGKVPALADGDVRMADSAAVWYETHCGRGRARTQPRTVTPRRARTPPRCATCC